MRSLVRFLCVIRAGTSPFLDNSVLHTNTHTDTQTGTHSISLCALVVVAVVVP